MLNDLKNWYLRTFRAKIFKVNSGFTGHGIVDSHWNFGAVEKLGAIIKPDGDWTKVQIKEKIQNKNGCESMACVSFALSNILKYLAKVQWNEDWDLSERYMAKMTNTTTSGNSMTYVLDQVRKVCGVVNESEWPWTTESTWASFYSSIPKNIIAKGQNWTKKYLLNYSVVVQNKQMMNEVLKRSPLYVCGYAWAKGSDGMYHSWGRANHCFDGVLIKINTDGSYVIKDSYPDENGSYFKTLAPDYLFGAIFSLTLVKNIQYNLDYIESLLKRGLEYVLLVSPFKDYSAGVYRLNPDGITNQDVVQEINDEGVRSFKEKGKLVGINTTDFSKLLV